jgi:uncharacterized protein YxeA
MKKWLIVISIILALVFSGLFAFYALSTYMKSAEEIIQQIQEQHPEAEIVVDEDGNFHVFVPEILEASDFFAQNN